MFKRMDQPISESSSLRKCNLPDTAHWRRWLRQNLESQEIGTGRFYERNQVDHIASKIGSFASSTNPPQAAQSGSIAAGASGVKRAFPLLNRLGLQGETR